MWKLIANRLQLYKSPVLQVKPRFKTIQLPVTWYLGITFSANVNQAILMNYNFITLITMWERKKSTNNGVQFDLSKRMYKAKSVNDFYTQTTPLNIF